MNNIITVNFKNVLSELELKNLKLCFLKNRGLFIEDNQENLYQMDQHRQGSYLDRLIKDGIAVDFQQVERSLSENIGDWEKEIWGISEVRGFMERQRLLN